MTEAPLARVSVRILEKEYQFSCAVDERAALLDSAEYLNTEMRKIRDSGKVIGLDRIAVMAALNMANELLKARARDTSGDGDVVHRIRHLRERLEATLGRGQQLEL
ncbi:MAG TPA: cell division protein ZapA [Steroidobacteraceae bacterium]|nr:cell division protein ZapA [Steroidobacteraceae bacterium]